MPDAIHAAQDALWEQAMAEIVRLRAALRNLCDVCNAMPWQSHEGRVALWQAIDDAEAALARSEGTDTDG